MKAAIYCVLALVCMAAVVNSAPIHGDELLNNIEAAAQHEVEKDNTAADAANDAADADEKQIEANQEFAEQIESDVKKSTALLDQMSADEDKTIEDANAIAEDAESGSESKVADIESQDADATDLSNQIQDTAEEVDKQLLKDMDSLQGVGVGKKAMLGETKDVARFPATNVPASSDQYHMRDGHGKHKKHGKHQHGHGHKLGEDNDFKSELAAEEESAKAEVAEAKSAEQAAEDRKAKAEDALNQMNQMAHDGFKGLKDSEAQLHADLNGHKDANLESDIEKKAEEIESLEGAPTPDEEPMKMSSASFMVPPVLLGESQDPMSLDEAMAQADSAADEVDSAEQDDTESSAADDQDDTEPQQMAAGDTDEVTTAIEAAEAAADEESTDTPANPMAAEEEDMAAQVQIEDNLAAEQDDSPEMETASSTDSGTIASDLKAIDEDAKALKNYQQQSLKEISNIKDPLQ
jgi:hypothetical protein